MPNDDVRRIAKNGAFEWPWSTARGLAIVTGAAGGGGGGGGALCIQGLTLHGSGGGGGGGGGSVTTLTFGEQMYQASGGNGVVGEATGAA